MAGYLPFDEPNLMALYRRRITIPKILENDWFKKDYKPPQFEQEEGVNLEDVDAVFNDSDEHLVTERKEKPVSMNAFELIFRSQGFSLENLFDKQMGHVKKETSLTSKCRVMRTCRRTGHRTWNDVG
ncbi:CBL-interacting serine/threonine-protein kinase 9 [Striga hermonthica]|uniref:CBL-interacting serine/threonine-protein kinase 9 n=1 Tax=Striga hermonthica TaxID=68872 RepID=A0A9N7NH14_STRHE|nr:CBL-interacting serine/threonine-protein kinase 9 [Striga hermonthica]